MKGDCNARREGGRKGKKEEGKEEGGSEGVRVMCMSVLPSRPGRGGGGRCGGGGGSGWL